MWEIEKINIFGERELEVVYSGRSFLLRCKKRNERDKWGEALKSLKDY